MPYAQSFTLHNVNFLCHTTYRVNMTRTTIFSKFQLTFLTHLYSCQKIFNNQNFFNNTHNNMPIRLHGKGKCWAYGAHILLHIALCCYADHLLRHWVIDEWWVMRFTGDNEQVETCLVHRWAGAQVSVVVIDWTKQHSTLVHLPLQFGTIWGPPGLCNRLLQAHKSTFE